MHAIRTQHNRMLYALFVLSLTLHIGIFIYLNGFYNGRTETRIEVTIQDRADSTKRVIPKPPNLTRPPERAQGIEKLTLPQPFSKPLSIKQVDYSYLRKLESIEAPHFVTSGNPLRDSWNFESSVDSNASLSSNEYLTMVRLRIERHKKYPVTAKARQLEGEAFIYFVIANDGHVEGAKVTKSSGYGVLDNAALTAVRNAAPFPEPPEEFFKKRIPIEVPIVFELL